MSSAHGHDQPRYKVRLSLPEGPGGPSLLAVLRRSAGALTFFAGISYVIYQLQPYQSQRGGPYRFLPEVAFLEAEQAKAAALLPKNNAGEPRKDS